MNALMAFPVDKARSHEGPPPEAFYPPTHTPKLTVLATTLPRETLWLPLCPPRAEKAEAQEATVAPPFQGKA